MKLTQDIGNARYVIRGYTDGEVQINDQRLAASVVVMPERLVTDWPPDNFDQLAWEHLEAVAAMAPEIVVLGTGPTLRFPPARVRALLESRGIGFEIMDTPAACRTYNVLMAEGRTVAAALLMR